MSSRIVTLFAPMSRTPPAPRATLAVDGSTPAFITWTVPPTGDVPDGAGPMRRLALSEPLPVIGNDAETFNGWLSCSTPAPTFWIAVADELIGTLIAVVPPGTLMTPVVSVLVPLTNVSGPVPLRV